MSFTAAWGQGALEYYNLGLENSSANKKIEYFTRAIQLNQNLAEAYEKRAIHYYFQWKLDKAIRDYTRVLELKPNRANIFMMRGLAYLKKEKGEGIMAEIRHLTYNLSKHKAPVLSKSLEMAIDDFSRAIELDPQLASAYSYRAEAYRIKGMIEEALKDSNTVIRLWRNKQSTSRAYATRAKIYWKLGQNELSASNFRKSVALNPYPPDYPPLHVPLIDPSISDTSTLKTISRLGLLIVIVLIFMVLFKLTLPAPKKKD
jgi:tetratricopeptide (TPR) repeat protein